MANKRVQIRDLEAPERIQPAPAQSSTFAEAAKPPIDNSLEELQKGLSMFGSSMNVLAAKQKAEDDKRIRTEQLAAYEAWKASVSSDEHLDAIRSGVLPISVDKILDTVVKKDGAQQEARKLAQEIDQDIGGAGLGSQGFDADAYVRDKAAPYVSRIGRDPRTMAYFGDHIDQIRAGVTRRHEEVRGQLQTQYLENRGKQEIGGGIQDGISRGMTPQQIMDGLRHPDPSKGIYAAVGPRLKKGSLDLSYGRMDEITLDVLDDMAQRPETALTAVGMLNAQRTGIDGQPIGPLTSVHKHSAKIESIQRKVLKTMGDYAEATQKAAVDGVNLTALERGGGTFSTIKDVKGQNPADLSRQITYSRDAQRDRAVALWLERTRAAQGGRADIQAETDFLMDRGVKHPEFEKVLNEAYTGFLSSTVAGQPATDRIPDIVRFGDEYIRIAERNPAFAETLVSKDAREFYDTYRVLRRYAGMDADKAAAATAARFSNPEYIKDPRILDGERQRFRELLNGLDLSPWWPGGQVANQSHARRILEPLANVLAGTGGQDAKSVFERAAAHLAETSAYVNGRIVHAPGIVRDDKPHVERLLASVFDQHKEAFKAQGVTKGDQLSLLSTGPTSFMVVKWDTGDILRVPTGYDEAGKPTGINFFTVQSSDILKLREAGRAQSAAEGVKALQKRIEAQKTNEPWYPHNVLRRIIEGGEVVPIDKP